MDKTIWEKFPDFRGIFLREGETDVFLASRGVMPVRLEDVRDNELRAYLMTEVEGFF